MLTAKNETKWAQKYRPQRLEHVILPATIKDKLINLRDKREVLGLLLHGEAGTGKSTIAGLINAENTYKVNCSLEKGVDKVREIAAQFTSHSLIGEDRPRVIMLDEADCLTQDAQAGLRSAIEDMSKINMFVLTTNLPEKIIRPLHSRLYSIDFSLMRGNSKLQKEMLIRAYEILRNEGVAEPDKSVVEAIVNKNFPDMRSILNTLQIELGLVDRG